MSSLTKAFLASALTLPLVAFVAGVLAAPDDVDPDRSRPVIIGKVDDDSGQEGLGDRAPDEGRPGAPRGDNGPGDDSDDDSTDGRGFKVVTPAPRDLDGNEDGGDDDNDDDTDDGGESRDD